MRKLNTAINKKINEILPDVPVYPAIADADAAMPYVVYTDESFTVDRTKDGIYATNHNISVQIWTDTFDKGDEMADMLLEAFCGKIAPKVNISLEGGSWGHSNGFYQVLNFSAEVDV